MGAPAGPWGINRETCRYREPSFVSGSRSTPSDDRPPPSGIGWAARRPDRQATSAATSGRTRQAAKRPPACARSGRTWRTRPNSAAKLNPAAGQANPSSTGCADGSEYFLRLSNDRNTIQIAKHAEIGTLISANDRAIVPIGMGSPDDERTSVYRLSTSAEIVHPNQLPKANSRHCPRIPCCFISAPTSVFNPLGSQRVPLRRSHSNGWLPQFTPLGRTSFLPRRSAATQ